MSRIIVKNLPKDIKEEKLKKLFSEKGNITDCSLKYTKDGVFRKFAFVGYRTPAEAEAAVNYFNKTFINTSRIQVEKAKDMGDPTKPRAWSKYSEDSSSHKKSHQIEEKSAVTKPTKSDPENKKIKNKLDSNLEELCEDAEFQEFLALHKNRSVKPMWGDDVTIANVMPESGKKKKKKTTAVIEQNEKTVEEDAGEKTVSERALNPDMEFLKSKVKQLPVFSDSEDDELQDDQKLVENEVPTNEEGAKYLVRMRGLPQNVKEKQLREFFHPIELKSCKLPHHGKKSGNSSNVTVEFYNVNDQEQAMGRNKSFIGQKKVFLHKITVSESNKLNKNEIPSWQAKLLAAGKSSDETESIAETGRLYIRNLPYCCTEDDIENLFKPYGLLSEIHMPIDSFTKKPKGFAFITFVIPENAVKAYSELDRQSFQGRLLHILPAKTKDDEAVDLEKLPFKQKKEALQKKSAASTHNWNTLFLGANTVADVIAEKYNTTKSQLLDSTSAESVGVRLALGETQVVAETRQFLIDHGIALDAFSQPAAQRSKTVLIVKNLPAKTTSEELSSLFGKHGTLGRLVLPPSGVTAVVEFLEPSEAKAAFAALAYTKFKHLPLYLEWGPVNTFTSTVEQPHVTSANDKKDASVIRTANNVSSESEDEDDHHVEGCTVFVKNLNFETTDQELLQFFEKCGAIRSAYVAKKKDTKNAGQLLSMGYGFVEYQSPSDAKRALKDLQHASFNGHTVELKISHRTTAETNIKPRKKQDTSKKPKSTKILVRNIPFEAKQKEIRELFTAFGELRTVRLPKKVAGTGVHRGFGFVDFITHHDAKRAFDALCHSTHLYGRRLVLEWANTDESIDELRQKTAEHFHEDGPKKKKQKIEVERENEKQNDT